MILKKILMNNIIDVVEMLKKRHYPEAFIVKVENIVKDLNKIKILESEKQILQQEKNLLVKEGVKSKNQVLNLNYEISVLESEILALNTSLEEILPYIPNFLQPDVPIGLDEKSNIVIKTYGAQTINKLTHYDMNLIDNASEMATSRFVLIKGPLATLERALGNFFVNFLLDNGFTEVSIPHMLNEKSLFLTGHIPKEKDNMFHIPEKNLYLIPTSECVLLNIMANQTVTFKDLSLLPLKYTAFNVNFRKEAGAAGKDTRGLIRLHQFPKVEMVSFAREEESEKVFQDFVSYGEKVLQLLGLSYRIVNLSSGDLGFNSAKTYDLEVWMSGSQEYREVSSISNCLSFQSSRLNCKYVNEAGEKKLLHTLNGTCLGVGRIVAAIMEKYYDEKEQIIRVPEILIPYTKFNYINLNKKI